MALAEVADVEALLGRTLTGGEATRVVSLIALAAGVVESYTGQTFAAVADDEVVVAADLDGQVRLPQRPVTAVTSVSVNGIVQAVSGYSWDADGFLGPLYGCWPGRAASGQPSVIEVVYSHGYATIPAIVRLVVAEQVRNVFTNPEQIRSESLGAYAVTYTIAAAGSALGLGLSDYHQRLLSKYRRRTTSVPILIPYRH